MDVPSMQAHASAMVVLWTPGTLMKTYKGPRNAMEAAMDVRENICSTTEYITRIAGGLAVALVARAYIWHGG